MLGAPVHLQARLRRLAVATNFLRVTRVQLTPLKSRKYLFHVAFTCRRKLHIACGDFFLKNHRRTLSAASPFPKKVSLAMTVHLQAPSQRLHCATNLFRAAKVQLRPAKAKKHLFRSPFTLRESLMDSQKRLEIRGSCYIVRWCIKAAFGGVSR